jgi:hypothetical protein
MTLTAKKFLYCRRASLWPLTLNGQSPNTSTTFATRNAPTDSLLKGLWGFFHCQANRPTFSPALLRARHFPLVDRRIKDAFAFLAAVLLPHRGENFFSF